MVKHVSSALPDDGRFPGQCTYTCTMDPPHDPHDDHAFAGGTSLSESLLLPKYASRFSGDG